MLRSRPRLRGILESVATVLTIVACLAVLSSLAYDRLAVGSNPVSSPQLARGVVLKASDGVVFGSDVTLLVGLSSTCHFCAESMPAFQELSSFTVSHAESVRVFALSIEPAESLKHYLSTNSLPGFRSIALDPNAPLSIVASRTPQLVAVDREGKILASWTGKITTDQMTAFLEKLHITVSGN